MATVRDLTPADAAMLTELYGEYEWWSDRDEASVRQALEETEIAIGIEDGGDLVAAARVLTDFVYYATVYDVIVAEDCRGEGYGKRLVRDVCDRMADSQLEGLSLLSRRGLVPFYESLGFEEFDEPVDVPEGGAEELVRMTYQFEDS